VSEDEAFIRAVVDSPGDDTPRLVYADWLDDRDDPRGPYLRAEAEALRQSRENADFRPLMMWHATYPTLAAGLDPLWLARLSRPPVGVCCDHVRFKERGPVIDSAGIDQVEQRLGGRFSADYRAFLLNYNGGYPDPPCVPDPNRGELGPLCLELDNFYSACRPGEPRPPDTENLWGSEIEEVRQFLEYLFEAGDGAGANPLIAGMSPFARTLHDLGYLLVGMADTNRGRVFHFRDYCHFSDDPGHLTELASSFSSFLALLAPNLED
jgi:uncharacterized protein (TIGR02996 family)